MLSPSRGCTIFIAKRPVDFRFGFDRLAHLCKESGGQDPYGGGLFLFFNKSYTKAKIIYFDGSGSILVWKRLEAGKFRPPVLQGDGSFATIGASDMMLLLEGTGTPWDPKKK